MPVALGRLTEYIFPRIYARTYYAHSRARAMSFSPPTRALTLQHERSMRQLHIAHAQPVRFANTRQCSGLEHAPETARHVQVPAITHAVT
jgi:hypothetical protein